MILSIDVLQLDAARIGNPVSYKEPDGPGGAPAGAAMPPGAQGQNMPPNAQQQFGGGAPCRHAVVGGKRAACGPHPRFCAPLIG